MGRTPASLVVSEEDRRRVREIERAVTSARKISFWSVVAIVPFLLHGYGPLLIVGVVAFGAYTAVVDWRYQRSSRPELWMFSLTMATQFAITAVALSTGGPQSAAMVFLVISMVSMPARYGTRGMITGTLISCGCLLVIAFSRGVDALMVQPDLPLVTAAACVACLAYGNALRHSESAQRKAAVLDPLTGLLNRTHLEDRFDEIREVAVARGLPLALVALDLDHFKQVNDQHGHARGDAVLVDTAYALRAALRDFELLYRMGGEEFVVFLPGTDFDAAQRTAEQLRQAVRLAQPGGLEVTVSIGVAVAAGSRINLIEQLDAADAALYEAKRGGRNRVIAVQLGEAPEAHPRPHPLAA